MFLWNRDVTHYLNDQAYIHTTAFTANLFLAFLPPAHLYAGALGPDTVLQ